MSKHAALLQIPLDARGVVQDVHFEKLALKQFHQTCKRDDVRPIEEPRLEWMGPSVPISYEAEDGEVYELPPMWAIRVDAEVEPVAPD